MGTNFYVILTVTAIIYGSVCCAFCKRLLTEKGYSEDRITDWEIAGFFFGIFALIAAAGLPDRKEDTTETKQGPSQDPGVGTS